MHVGELRERDIAAERQPGQAVLDAILAPPGEDLRPETDGKTRHVHPAAPRGEKVPELVHKDGPAKEQDDQEDRPEVRGDGLEQIGGHVLSQDFMLVMMDRAAWRAAMSASRTASRSPGSKLETD